MTRPSKQKPATSTGEDNEWWSTENPTPLPPSPTTSSTFTDCNIEPGENSAEIAEKTAQSHLSIDGTAASEAIQPHVPVEVKRHPKWSWDEIVYLLIQNTLYAVPRPVLRDSSWFTDRLSRSNKPISITNPLIFQDVSVSEMDALLEILDARVFNNTISNLTYEEWAAILHLSTKWDFAAIRSLAIDKFDSTFAGRDPFERLGLAFKCQVAQWIHPIYMQLCERPTSLSVEEASILDLPRTMAITRIREQLLRASRPIRSTSPVEVHRSRPVERCLGSGPGMAKSVYRRARSRSPPCVETSKSVDAESSAMDVASLVKGAKELDVPFQGGY